MSPATRTNENRADAPPPGRALRVLIVDDNRDSVLSLMMLLRAEGHDTKGCYNGEDVIACIRDYEPDAVVLDINLPGRSGWDVAQDIRKRQIGSKRLLLIGVTGEYTKGADKILAEMSGFDYYLVKPTDPNVLTTLLEKAARP